MKKYREVIAESKKKNYMAKAIYRGSGGVLAGGLVGAAAGGPAGAWLGAGLGAVGGALPVYKAWRKQKDKELLKK